MEHNNLQDMDAPKEQFLTHLWRDHLNRSNIDPAADFFAAGGSSMQAIEMLMTVSNRYNREIDYAEFFQEPCIRKLCELLDR